MNVRVPKSNERAPFLPDEVFAIRDADLSPEVRPLAVNIHEQIYKILARHSVDSIAVFEQKLLHASPREVLAAADDVAMLMTLLEKLEYIFDQVKPLESAFADRHQLGVLADRMRAALDDVDSGFTSSDELRLLPSLIVADVYLGRDPIRDVVRLSTTPGFSSLERNKLTPCLRALGAFHCEDDAEGLWEAHESTHFERSLLRAVYAAALPDEYATDREVMLHEARMAVPLQSENRFAPVENAFEYLAALAQIELDAGRDVAETLARITELRSVPSSQQAHADAASALAHLYARVGDEASMRKMTSSFAEDTDMTDAVWANLGMYYAEKGDMVNCERILGVINEPWNAIDLYTRVALPLWITRNEWEKVATLPQFQCIKSLCKNRPDLVDAYYAHIPVDLRDAYIDAVYARHLAAHGAKEEFVAYKHNFLKLVVAAIMRPPKAAENEDDDSWLTPVGADAVPDIDCGAFAEYLIATEQRGEPLEDLFPTLVLYVQSLSRNRDGEIVSRQYNEIIDDVIDALVAEGATDIALRVVDTMYSVSEETSGSVGFGWGQVSLSKPAEVRAKVLARQLDDVVARVQAARGMLRKVQG